MAGPGRNPRQWAVLAGGLVFAERPSRAQAEAVLEEHADLLRAYHGQPQVVAPVVVDLDARRRAREAFLELERRGFVALPG